MTKDIVFSLLEKVKSCGFVVVAIVSDLGGANRGLLKELAVTTEQPWYNKN